MGEEGGKVKVTVKTEGEEDDLSFRLPNPPEFNGIRSRDSVSVHDWVVLVRQHILMRKMKVNSGEAVHFAALFLRGPALTWFNAVESTLPRSFDRFKDKLIDAFAPLDESVLARERLKRLVHKDSLEKYCDLFRRYALLVTSMSPEDKVERFVDGLQPWLRTHVRTYLLDRPKDDLELVVKAALLMHFEMRKDKYTNSASSAPRAQVKALDASTEKPVRKCYKCGSPDHLRAQCPQVRRGKGRKPGSRESKGQPPQSNA